MDTIKITDKLIASEFEDDAHFLVAQTRTVNGEAVEEIVQVPYRKILDKVQENPWRTIQQNVRAGKAQSLYPIGHEFMTHYTYNGTVYDMPWVVLDNNRECEWADGSKHPGLWIGSKFATIEEIQFDAAEREEATEATALAGLFYCGRSDNGSTYTMLNLNAGEPIPYDDYEYVYHGILNNREAYIYGYDRYLHSGVRQWLNSAEGIGNWWSAQHVGDCAPSQLQTVKGFMAGLDADFLTVINPVKVQAVTNNVTDGGVTDVMYDRFFLPSVEEMYGVPDIEGIEGPYFPYWKQATVLESPSNGSNESGNDARKIRKINGLSGESTKVRLRSASRAHFANAWYVHDFGYLLMTAVYASNAVLPACVIS